MTVIKLSETDMIIQTDTLLATGTNLHFTKPVEMFVNIQPVAKPSGKTPEYYGVIHSIGETDKKELRRCVQAIFFRDHDAKLAAENEEVAKLKELKQQEKIAIVEAAAKAAAEAAAEGGTVEKETEVK